MSEATPLPEQKGLTWRDEDACIEMRSLLVSDVPFVTSSWLRSNRDSPTTWGIANTEYFHYGHLYLEELLARCTTLVMCNSQNPDQILGYLTYERLSGDVLVLHYLYIKKPYRDMGLGTALVDEILTLEGEPDVVQVTHSSKASRSVLNRKEQYRRWRYNPYLVFATMPSDWAR